MRDKSDTRCYSEKLKDPRWQKLRLKILEAADWRCEDCGASELKRLDVHHTAYCPKWDPWEYGIEWLMALCEDCHKDRQQKEDAFRMSLGKLTRFLKPEQLEQEVWRIIEEASNRETERLAESFSCISTA